jgi:hypothetical protein
MASHLRDPPFASYPLQRRARGVTHELEQLRRR